VRNFLFEYRKVLLTNNIEKALKEAFNMDFDEFDRHFSKYLRQKYIPALMSKEEPLDYGKEIGLHKPGKYTFSPTLSPSGELVAALATPKDELDVVILSAPGESRECVEIARRLHEEAERGTPFDRMAIVLRSTQQYRAHLEEALRRASIPAHFARGTVRPDPAGRGFIALLAKFTGLIAGCQ